MFFLTKHLISKASSFFEDISHNLSNNVVVIGWGLKPSAAKIKAIADKHDLPFWRVEDGFIAYLNHSSSKQGLLSLSVDTSGIYYDATNSSDIETYIINGLAGDELNLSNDEYVSPRASVDKMARVKALQAKLIQHHITKYNLSSQAPAQLAIEQDAVLVVDQTFGDLSVAHSYASADSFRQMLQCALDENPNKTIYVKTHPDVILGKKQGFLPPKESKHARIQFLTQACNPMLLVAQCEKIYTVCSQLGFDALVQGKQVITFGTPFYAGWGLTDDRGFIPERRRGYKKSIYDLIYAAYIKYVRYVHPDTHQRCDVEDVIDYIALQKSAAKQYNTLYCCDFSWWKQAFLPDFLKKYAPRVKFIKSTQVAKIQWQANDALVVWGAKPAPSVSLNQQPNVLRIEDGFIRSVGLGADLRRPSSLVVDSRGIYFDPRQPSDLEFILNNLNLNTEQQHRAALLLAQLIQTKVSKYNVSDGEQELSALSNVSQRKILVVGQVEDDASIQTGCIDIKTNLHLLQNARLANPDACIIYKPHPDVLSGNRQGHIPPQQVKQYADLQLTRAGIIECIELVDELHTLTSLAGFEALIRGKKVVCYGLPFYAGWGLTEDKYPIERRQKKLALTTLVYGALIEYPLYVNEHTFGYTSPEFIISTMQGKKGSFVAPLQIITTLSRIIRKIRFLAEITFRLLRR
ncbi:beta-3-deoxy-D-manno-oct-2-ulosonic acid transferase [Saccharobesus litoralis]|uniref:Beta-3-deoxy-D-manno-oct-2-ulosonic acid transferase n=1 Tax=Saccharobesus litoralis TaxID=2172099 RepID=A0A2S0VW12_9ALTE|nr:polysialyltransferase family glycosyltransferase [Saccharobesus litoralis]AWB68401.1 beta-3-deoxy-D-manno-oct-2-ulosonic acid transferase [Saccharobesus litoralis]